MFLLFANNSVFAKEYTISVVNDLKSDFYAKITESIEQELKSLSEGKFTTRFVVSGDNSNDISLIKNDIQNALNSDSDLVLLNGVLAAGIAVNSDLSFINKATVSSFSPREDILELFDNGMLKKENLSMMYMTHSVEQDLEKFREIYPYKNLLMIVDQNLESIYPHIKTNTEALAKDKFNLKFFYEGDLEGFIKKNNIDAVYLTPMLSAGTKTMESNIKIINKMKIPSFSLLGKRDLEFGALATMAPDIKQQVSKRVALNIYKLLYLGQSVKDLPIVISSTPKLIINAKTASEIGLGIDFKLQLEAEIINQETLTSMDTGNVASEELSLEKAIEIALQNNSDLEISKFNADEFRARKKISRSNLLPQIDFSASFQGVADDRTSLQAVPETDFSLDVEFRQMIFNDTLISDFRSSKRIAQSQELTYIKDKLDLIELVAVEFYNYLSLIQLYKTELINFKQVQKNLDLVRARYKVGDVGGEELYRWLGEKANSQSNLITAEANVKSQLVTLNQIMNVDMTKTWQVDIDKETERQSFFIDSLGEDVHTDQELDIFRAFAKDLAFKESLELQAIDKEIKATQITLGQRKRRFFLPDISLGANYTNVVDQNFDDDLNPAFAQFNQTVDNQFSLGIEAALPLLQGGKRFHDIELEKATLNKLNSEKDFISQTVERKLRQSIFSLTASIPNIDLSNIALENSRKNLDLIQEKYSFGDVDLIRLVDAQSNFFSSIQAAYIAKLEYLADVIALQRSLSWFEFNKSEETMDSLKKNFEEFINEKK